MICFVSWRKEEVKGDQPSMQENPDTPPFLMYIQNLTTLLLNSLPLTTWMKLLLRLIWNTEPNKQPGRAW